MTASVNILRGDLHLAVSTAFNRGRYVLMTDGDGRPREITIDLRERPDDLFAAEDDCLAASEPETPRTVEELVIKLSLDASEFEASVAAMRLKHPGVFGEDDHGAAIPAQTAKGFTPGPLVYEFGIHDVERWRGTERDYALAQTTVHDAPDPAAAAAADWVHVFDRKTRERRTLKRPPPSPVETGLYDLAADLRAIDSKGGTSDT